MTTKIEDLVKANAPAEPGKAPGQEVGTLSDLERAILKRNDAIAQNLRDQIMATFGPKMAQVDQFYDEFYAALAERLEIPADEAKTLAVDLQSGTVYKRKRGRPAKRK